MYSYSKIFGLEYNNEYIQIFIRWLEAAMNTFGYSFGIVSDIFNIEYFQHNQKGKNHKKSHYKIWKELHNYIFILVMKQNILVMKKNILQN